jgi:glycine dehydrogenase subunit 1
MPFIPHTADDVRDMLSVIGANRIEDLFDEIPAALRITPGAFDSLPEGLNEMEVTRLMQQRAQADGTPLNFIGAGAYEHHIPAAVWEITTRGEFYSAYTPYQAEASQGTLQLLYEYQTMMSGLMAMEVSNASLYDGASALAEAVLMAVRAHKTSKTRRVLLPTTIHPAYRAVVRSVVSGQNIELVELPYCMQAGTILREALAQYAGQDITALAVPQPNFFGMLEDVDALTDWAHAQGALVIGVVNPLAMALLKPPGEWGARGADIACGDGQPLGIPLASGGPYYGFLTSRMEHVRQMPGRIIGRTVDLDGKPGFSLTLQAREQHIRRSKATSNICTNQGLMVTASTLHMSILGSEGLRRVAAACHAGSNALHERLQVLAGVKPLFAGPHLHERAYRLGAPVDDVLRSLASDGVQGGYALGRDYPELGDALLTCTTETKVAADLDHYAALLGRAIGLHRPA